MEVTLTDDQEFFRDTTRKFLGERVPDRQGAGARRVRRRVRARLLAPGRRARAGCRCSSPRTSGGGSVSGNGVVDLTLVADAFGPHVAPGPLLPCNVVAAALARSGSDEQQDERPARRSSPARSSPRGPSPSCRPHDAPRRRHRDRRRRRRRLRALRREGAGRGGRPGRAAARHRRAPTPVSRSSWCPPTPPGVTITPLRQRRPRAPVRARRVRRGHGSPATRCGRRAGRRRRRRRAPAAARGRHPVGRDGRRRRDGVRLHARLGVQPLLVRSAARVVPGDQAPLRRHEDVARGEPRARRQRRRGDVQADAPERRRDGQRGQGLRRRLPRRAGPGLRADARWHRRHVRARHPPVPAPRHRRPRSRYGTPADHRQRIADLREAHAA